MFAQSKNSQLSCFKKIILRFLENKPDLYDVVLLVEEEKRFIPCHEFVLTAASPVFEQCFLNFYQNFPRGIKPKLPIVVPVNDCSFRDVETIIGYIYFGELNRKLDEDLISLMNLATKLGIFWLVEEVIERTQEKYEACSSPRSIWTPEDEEIICRIEMELNEIMDENTDESLVSELESYPDNLPSSTPIKSSEAIPEMGDSPYEMKPNCYKKWILQKNSKFP